MELVRRCIKHPEVAHLHDRHARVRTSHEDMKLHYQSIIS